MTRLARLANWLRQPARSFSEEASKAYFEAWGRAAGGWNVKDPAPPDPLPLDHPGRRWRAGEQQAPSRLFVLFVGGSVVAVVAAVFVTLALVGAL
jgi:hypothetical protein